MIEKDKIITEQLIEIKKLKKQLSELSNVINLIDNRMYCIGGPLNDNVNNYTKDQLSIFFEIDNIISNKTQELIDKKHELITFHHVTNIIIHDRKGNPQSLDVCLVIDENNLAEAKKVHNLSGSVKVKIYSEVP